MKQLKIGIAGAGGLGSNVALNLVRSGIDAFRIVDFDCVEASNLNRQFYFRDQTGRPKVEALRENLQRIRPEVEIDAIVARIDATNCRTLFGDCDLVVEAFDKAAAKKMLMEGLAGDQLVVSDRDGDLAQHVRRRLRAAQLDVLAFRLAMALGIEQRAFEGDLARPVEERRLEPGNPVDDFGFLEFVGFHDVHPFA